MEAGTLCAVDGVCVWSFLRCKCFLLLLRLAGREFRHLKPDEEINEHDEALFDRGQSPQDDRGGENDAEIAVIEKDGEDGVDQADEDEGEAAEYGPDEESFGLQDVRDGGDGSECDGEDEDQGHEEDDDAGFGFGREGDRAGSFVEVDIRVAYYADDEADCRDELDEAEGEGWGDCLEGLVDGVVRAGEEAAGGEDQGGETEGAEDGAGFVEAFGGGRVGC